jgi:hypothetical protein
VERLLDEDGPDHDRHPEVERSPRPAAGEGLPQLITTEANLLRLPLFALHTKRLKTLDGIECKGRYNRDGQTHEFVFRATRNTATLYPGPLARSVHLAFLSKVTDQGFPVRNPLTWTWRDLCRRMGISYGGQMVTHLKDAITSTAALFIHSEYALYSKADKQPIRTQQEGLHLYDRVVFLGSQLPDGTTADTNHLWFSDWYLSNLNAMFTAPLDYTLWRHLDEHSTIASRLYEFLLLNFYSGVPVLRINYDTLVQFLPIRPERYLSDAKRQMGTALQLLTDTKVIDSVAWTDGKNTLAQLHLRRGARLAPANKRDDAALPWATGEIGDGIQVRELRNLKTPAWQLVTDFYKLWSSESQRRPTQGELDQARLLIDEHGPAKAKGLIPLVVKRLKVEWPEAKTFGAIAMYLPAAVRDFDREKHRLEQERQERLRDEQETQESEQRRAAHRLLQETWKPVWDALPAADRESIERAVAETWPHYARVPVLMERKCLEELARQRTNPLSPDITSEESVS